MALRSPKSSSRTMANRRALRPDRQIYRQMRQNQKKIFDLMLVVEISIIVLGLLGIGYLIYWLFFKK